MKKLLTASFSAFIMGVTSSSAALLLTFTEESGDVVMRTSGSFTPGSQWFTDSTIIAARNGFGGAAGVVSNDDGVFEHYVGEDLLAGHLMNGHKTASQVIGDNFEIWGYNVKIWGGTFDNSAPPILPITVDATLVWTGATFTSLGLDNHASDTTIDLWGTSSHAPSNEKVQFIVSTQPAAVPEPASTSLLALGALAMLLRRLK